MESSDIDVKRRFRFKKLNKAAIWIGGVIWSVFLHYILTDLAPGWLFSNSWRSALVLVGGTAIYMILLAIFIVACALPGSKAKAKVVGKEKTPDKKRPLIELRFIIFDIESGQQRIRVDEWDYNHIHIGDEGIIEYKQNELISFTRQASKVPASSN